MSTDIHQLRRENSEGAIIRRKRLVKLGHLAAYTWQPFDEMHLKPHLTQVQRGLDACNTTPNHQHIPIHE
jgi:hypothetical protein